VLSCDVIIWDDNTPLFIFPENFTHSEIGYNYIFHFGLLVINTIFQKLETIKNVKAIYKNHANANVNSGQKILAKINGCGKYANILK